MQHSKARSVANEFIRLADREEEPVLLTNLHVQKLLYYAQGWHAAMRDGRPLFNERIEAWKLGPVVPQVYGDFKRFGAGAVRPVGAASSDTLDEDSRAIIRSVWEGCKVFSALELSRMTHQEAPWRDHFRPDSEGRGDQVIPVAALAAYFARDAASLIATDRLSDEAFDRGHGISWEETLARRERALAD